MSDPKLPTVVWRGESIPLFVLGTAQLGLPGYGVANKTDGMDQERADAIVAAAWNAGVRFFDTAQAYGDSEERLRRAFRHLGLGHSEQEQKARIITKLAPDLDCTDIWELMNVLAYVDGNASLLEIAENIGVDIAACAEYARTLTQHGLILILLDNFRYSELHQHGGGDDLSRRQRIRIHAQRSPGHGR